MMGQILDQDKSKEKKSLNKENYAYSGDFADSPIRIHLYKNILCKLQLTVSHAGARWLQYTEIIGVKCFFPVT